jgi:ribokinase
MAQIAVVGHIEWVDFLRVQQLPARGQITPARRVRANAGGGAVVAAVTLARLGAEVDFYSAVGNDTLGERAIAQLARAGVRTHVSRRPGPTRQVITLLEDGGERSIITVGERLAAHGGDPLAWDRLRRADGVYVTAADEGALHAARAAAVLCASPRIAETLAEVGEPIDALILSASDAAEVAWAEALSERAGLIVATAGAAGGQWSGQTTGSWAATPPPGPVCDSYGAGDAFAAGFTYGLAVSGDPAEAARIGADCGARALTRPGGP